jgi:hypothetical protein
VACFSVLSRYFPGGIEVYHKRYISLASGPAQCADSHCSPCVQIELYAGVRTRVRLLYAGSRVKQDADGALPSVWSLLSFGPCKKTLRYHQLSENVVSRPILKRSD